MADVADAPLFVRIARRSTPCRPVEERIRDFRDVGILPSEAESRRQASRCLGCFLPFCHWTCPLSNTIPEWNQHVARGEWAEAYRVLQATNNLPEVTARVCPATCEAACVLNINDGAVTIRDDELAIIERAFQAGDVQPHPPARRSGTSVAVIGSGPAGLACADQLNQAGHRVVVFERDDKIGGLLRYGIPDFKLEKWIIDRRLAVWRAEGMEFVTGVTVGVDVPWPRCLKEFDAICLAMGARTPRDLPIDGRSLRGIHFAMEYLTQSNRRVAGERIADDRLMDARAKRVVVIGGGDTGADCVGTALRQGAARVIQVELLPQPPATRQPTDVWPDPPAILKTSTSHEEGGARLWSVLTKRFLGERGMVKTLSCVNVEWAQPDPTSRPVMREVPGSEFDIEADLVLLAMGFVSPEHAGLLDAAKVQYDARGNVSTDGRQLTSIPKVFAAGDMRRGQSLVVWALHEGRMAAHHIDRYLAGT